MKFLEAIIDNELLFEQEIDEYLLRSQKISCKLPAYKTIHRTPELSMHFSEVKLQEAPRVIEQKRNKSKSKQLW